jgi:hypothetical protein
MIESLLVRMRKRSSTRLGDESIGEQCAKTIARNAA